MRIVKAAICFMAVEAAGLLLWFTWMMAMTGQLRKGALVLSLEPAIFYAPMSLLIAGSADVPRT
jgi:hypothetical protein